MKDFVMQLHTAISKFNENQAKKPGSSFKAQLVLSLALFLSLFLVGSCNEKIEIFDFLNNKPAISNMSKGQMVRHSYKVQATLSQNPAMIHSFSHQELQLALAAPDLKRVEGRAEIWHYAGNECTLDIYWVKKPKENLQQTHYEFRERRGLFQNIDYKNYVFQDWQCVQSLIQERRKKIEANFNDL